MLQTIENSNLRLIFNDETGNIAELRNKLTGDNYIKIIPDNKIFSLGCIKKGNGKKERFGPLKPILCTHAATGNTAGLELLYKGLMGENPGTGIDIDIRLFVTIKDDYDIEWKMELKNNDTGYDVVEVLFPHIRGIYLGGTWKDDIVIYPHHAGEKTLNPVEEYTSVRYLNFRRAGTKLLEGIYSREINYCGLASMMWMYYYDSQNGFYISSHDSDFLVTGMRVETGGPADPWMGFGIRKYLRIPSGGEWKSNPYITSINCEDWHWGAKAYRKWIEPYIKVDGYPSRMKDEAALNQCYNFKKDGGIHNKFDQIPRIFDYGREKYGIKHLFIASWNRKGFDCNYPEYYPDMELGTSMDLYNGCKYVNDHGGFVTFYINARIFDIGSDFFPALGKAMAIKNADGSLIFEQYDGTVKFSVMCPSDEGWRKLLTDTAEWLVRSYGATGVYLDQLGSAEPFPCYDSEHTHKDIGEFNTGYLSILKELKERIGKLNENAFLMIENCGDIYGSCVWGSLTWSGEPYDDCYNVFKYTFPEYVQVNMVNPKTNLKGEERKARFYLDMERALLLGSVLWLGVTYKFGEDDEELEQYAQKAVSFRKKLCPFIASGRYVDDRGILGASPGIKASVWELENGNRLIIAGNIDDRSGCRLTMEADDRPLKIISEDIEGNVSDIKYEYHDGRLEIELSTGKITYFLIVKE